MLMVDENKPEDEEEENRQPDSEEQTLPPKDSEPDLSATISPQHPEPEQAQEQTQQEASEPETHDSDSKEAQAVLSEPDVAFDEPQQTPTPAPVKKPWFRPELIFIPSLRRKLGHKARPTAVAVLLLLLVLIGGLVDWRMVQHTRLADKQTFKFTTAAFKLLSTVPANNATNVNTASNITLNFNQPVNPNTMINNMFVSPSVTGKFSQGGTKDQIVFTPDQPFNKGTKITVMINGTFESSGGTKLGNPYFYGFTTSIPGNGVEFQAQNGLIDNLVSLQSGQKEKFSLLLGSNVAAGASVTLYKGTVSGMLDSLVYGTGKYGGREFTDLAVSTSGLTPVYHENNISNNENLTVAEPDGLYVAVATSSAGKELGLVWINYSNFGVLLRQDDQKTVYDAQSFNGSSDVAVNMSFYSLNGGVTLDNQTNTKGLTTTDLPYSKVDLVVAKSGKETAVIPVNIPDSGGDIRVDQNLSNALMVYGLTDKPTYKVGETLSYAGFVRADNDALYTLPGASKINLYVAKYKYATKIASFSVPVDSNGRFSGSINVPASWLTSGDSFDQLQIFAASVGGNQINDTSVASFSVTAAANPASRILVSFSKPSYLNNDQVTATISGTKDGQPLANTPIELHIYAKDYYENDPAANLENFGYTGNELSISPAKLELNAEGKATYTLNTANLPGNGTSQLVTLEANLPGTSGVGAAGGDSAIIHQGNAVITFGTDRTFIPEGDGLISDIYVNDLSGNPLSGSSVSYQLVSGSGNSVLASGSVVTDSSGHATINVPASDLSGKNGMQLLVKTTDSQGNSVTNSQYYSVDSGAFGTFTSGASLDQLNINGSSTNLTVGQNVSLNVYSPGNIRALITYDRGRIYNPALMQLSKGSNQLNFSVSKDLAPSFTLTINYFYGGKYHSEGVTFNVSDPAKESKISLVNPAAGFSANKPASVGIKVNNNAGNPLQADVIAEVVSSNAYDLTSSVVPDIFSVLYNPRPIMTSSSSSLSPVGSGGGRCGGGGGDLPSFANALGTTLYWQPNLTTDNSGQTTINFTPPAGSWTLNVYVLSGDSIAGHQSETFSAS